MTIATLIDKQDTFEIVRDQIAAILITETLAQQALATAAAKDPNLWKFRVFSERSNPWEEYLNDEPDTSPLVNVWYDSTSFDGMASNVVERQKGEGLFNIDCYAYGISQSDVTGHKPGDEEAALTLHRAIRLVRNILMAADYTYLGLQKTVWKRWPQAINVYQPQQGNEPVENVIAARIQLRVDFNEFSPQIAGNAIEYLANTVTRAGTGEVFILADYTYPIV